MKILKIYFVSLSEMRYPGSGECNVGEHKIYYLGNSSKRHKNGVGIIFNNSAQMAVIGYFNNRIEY